MPALYTHLRFGRKVLSALPEVYTKAIKRYPEAFALGTQGPDILFYHKPVKSNETRKKGTVLHTWSGEKFFLAQGAKLLENAPDGEVESLLGNNGALAAYTCGFLCHFTLDTLCHPYIDGNSNENRTHGKIESEFDKFNLRLDGMPIRGYNTATPIIDENGVSPAVAKTLEVDEESVVRSIKAMHVINKNFSFKREFRHYILHTLLKICKMERKFGDMFLHKKDDPLCVETNEVLSVKFQEAIPQAVALIQEYFNNLRVWVDEKHTTNNLFRYDFSGILHTEE